MASQKTTSYNGALKLAIRNSRRKTQRRVARAARIDETILSRIISGEREPSPEERERLANVLRRPERELFPNSEPAAAAQ